MTRTIETIEQEKYSERELEELAEECYGDEEVIVLGMPMQSLYILKHMDIPAYNELLNGLQEDITAYVCPICKDEHEEESDAEDCCIPERIAELEEMKQEFILNESWIPEDQSPSWGDIAEVSAIAESKWNDTAEGKELKSLLSEQKIILNGTFSCPECHFTEKHLASCSHRKDI